MSGKAISDAIKNKHSNLALYNGFLLITLTKNLKMLYLNLDSLFNSSE